MGVIGKVGSGKSSLLSALLAEMSKVRGHVRVADLHTGFAIATQEPWIQHASIRDNILFGRQYNSRRYEATIEACALTEDFKVRIEPPRGKTNNVVSEQVRHKPTCTVTEKS